MDYKTLFLLGKIIFHYLECTHPLKLSSSHPRFRSSPKDHSYHSAFFQLSKLIIGNMQVFCQMQITETFFLGFFSVGYLKLTAHRDHEQLYSKSKKIQLFRCILFPISSLYNSLYAQVIALTQRIWFSSLSSFRYWLRLPPALLQITQCNCIL